MTRHNNCVATKWFRYPTHESSKVGKEYDHDAIWNFTGRFTNKMYLCRPYMGEDCWKAEVLRKIRRNIVFVGAAPKVGRHCGDDVGTLRTDILHGDVHVRGHRCRAIVERERRDNSQHWNSFSTRQRSYFWILNVLPGGSQTTHLLVDTYFVILWNGFLNVYWYGTQKTRQSYNRAWIRPGLPCQKIIDELWKLRRSDKMLTELSFSGHLSNSTQSTLSCGPAA